MKEKNTLLNTIEPNISQDLQQVVADILRLAQQQGATQAEAAASQDIGLSVTVRMGTVESIEFNRGKSIGITVYKGKRKGSASSTDTSPAAIKDAINAACNIAEYTEEDKYSGLADKEYLAKEIPDLQLYHPADIGAEQALALAKECEEHALAYDPRIKNADGTSFFSNVHYGAYGNSNGFLAGYPTSRYSLSCSVIGQDNKGGMQRDDDYTLARDFKDLNAAKNVGIEAARKTIARLGARKIKTIKAPVLLVPAMARGLIASFISAISGGNLYRKTSFLVDALHQKIFPQFINIYEDPLILKAIGSTAFDSEGVATKRRELVQAGVLQGYVLGSYSARKLGMQTTGNASGVHNLMIKSGNCNLVELAKKMDQGLMVTELMGHGINLTTGDYSRGACGFWVQGGQIQHPVEEVTIAGNLKDMLANIVEVGNDIDYRGNIRTGSILLDTMMIAGE